MRYDKFFELAKAKGITEAEINASTDSELSISLFQGEIDNYESSNSSSYILRGLYKGKMGAVISDSFNTKDIERYIDQIIENAKYIECDDPAVIFKGSEKYKRINTFNKELNSVSLDTKIAALFEIEKKIKSLDKRISEVESVSYCESISSHTIINSHGLKLNQKNNFYYYYGGAVAKENGQTKTGGKLFFDNDYSKFNIDEFVQDIVKEATEQLNGEACNSGAYKAVLAPDVVKSLLNAYLSSAIAEDVQKNSSLFINKLGKRVASSKVTVFDKPLSKNVFARYFDDEGVATYNKAIIKNGILQTYLYNLSSASKENRDSTGNGVVAGSTVATDTWFVEMKPGKKSKEELYEEVENGVLITDVQGLHAGLNPRSGNFSLQSNGFLIKDGKKDRPLDIITISGNLVDLFNSVTTVGNDSKKFVSGFEVPSVIVKKLLVSGK